LLSLPDAAERFRANVPAAVELAARTGCQTMNALYGNRMPGVDPKIQDELAQRNLAIAAEAAAAVGATVVIETQNTADSPDYPLTRMADALRVVAAAQADNVAVLADLYHLYRMGEDLEAVITGYVDRLGHVQVADAPGRHQPGTGEIPFDRLLELLAAKGYERWVGLEYKPLGASADSFEWLPQERRHAASTA
jgi:hydroxypyruvate isomerase